MVKSFFNMQFDIRLSSVFSYTFCNCSCTVGREGWGYYFELWLSASARLSLLQFCCAAMRAGSARRKTRDRIRCVLRGRQTRTPYKNTTKTGSNSTPKCVRIKLCKYSSGFLWLISECRKCEKSLESFQ